MRSLLVALLLLGCAACDPSVEGRVCGFGDSIIHQDGEELAFALGEGRLVPDGTMAPPDGLPDFLARERSDVYTAIAAMVGARLDVSIATNWHAGRLHTAGIACTEIFASWGTNDASGPLGWLPEMPLAERIDRFMADMGTVPVLWLVPTSTDRPPANIHAWQDALGAATLRWPNLVLLWGDPAWVGPDGTHYTADGQVALANAIADHLEEMAQ